MSMLWSTVIGCGVALGNDVWMDLEYTDGDDQIALHLPANWIGLEDDAMVQTPDGPVDLAVEVRRLRSKRPGARRSFEVVDDDGDVAPLVLSTERGGGSTDQVQVAALGPLGNGLTVSFALGDGSTTNQATGKLDAAFDVNGLELKVEDAFVAQLRSSGPAVLLQSTGPKGGAVTIETR